MQFFSRISIQERVDFATNLGVMLKSGIPLDEALTALGEQSESPSLRTIIRRVQDDIENGTELSLAFEKEAPIFGKIFVNMIKAGEQSGTLQSNLQFLASLLTRSADLKREVNAAMLYPKVVFGAALLLGGGLAVFILPTLVPLFTGLNVELPFITRTLLAISVFVQQYWFFVILSFIGVFFGFMYVSRILRVQRVLHRMYIGLPLLGSLMKNYQLAFITQLFGTLLKSGLTLNDSLHIVREAVSNVCYSEALRDMKVMTERGRTLSESMKEFEHLFPKIVVSVVAIGEKSGTLVDSFNYISELYAKEVSMQAKRLPTIIEPILLVFIAFVVGFIALSIIMPIYELTGSMSR